MRRERTYRFLAIPAGRSRSTRDFQRSVRSHAASVSHRGQTTRRQARVRLRNAGEGVISFDTDPIASTEDDDPGDLTDLPADTQTDELIGAARSGQSVNRSPISTLSYRLAPDHLSGNAFSPLRQLPTYHRPYLPGVVNHYIDNLTIPIPELDGVSAVTPFRAAWLPVVFHDPVVFQVVVLFAATHYATFASPAEFDQVSLELLALKQLALLALIQSVQAEQSTRFPIMISRSRNSRDTLIAAAAKMASYEALFGSADAFHLHMSTVVRLLGQQGGLATLGMSGFLARLLAFIDTNSAYLLGTNLYLVEFGLLNSMPHHQPFHPRRPDQIAPQAFSQITNTNVANLERSIGNMNNRDTAHDVS